MYALFKLLHIFLMMAWFAGLFYLPRLFVNLAEVPPHDAAYPRLLMMAERLFRFMTPLGVGALLCGLSLATVVGWWSQGWVHVKVGLAVLLVGYHVWCYRLLLAFRLQSNRRTAKWFRVFNELPVLILALALYFVIYKPF